MTEDEYLAYDAAHEGKHEYVNGELIAMAGSSEALATANVIIALGGALRGSPCRTYSPDLPVRTDETGMYAYPDVTVVCGRAELSTTSPPSLLNPKVVVEVLSSSTEAYDRGAKAAHYRQRASIEAIVFVAIEEHRVEVHTRNPDGTWTLSEATSPCPPSASACPSPRSTQGSTRSPPSVDARARRTDGTVANVQRLPPPPRGLHRRRQTRRHDGHRRRHGHRHGGYRHR